MHQNLRGKNQILIIITLQIIICTHANLIMNFVLQENKATKSMFDSWIILYDYTLLNTLQSSENVKEVILTSVHTGRYMLQYRCFLSTLNSHHSNTRNTSNG